jgi:hypothetical protein
MDDVFGWVGGAAGSFADPANWFDFTTGFAGAFVPGANDTVIFPAGDVTVTGGGQVNLLLFEPGANVTLAGTGTEHYRADTAIAEPGSQVFLSDATLNASFFTLGQDAHLDISDGAPSASPPFDPNASAAIGTLRLLGPGGSAGGASVEFGSHDILLVFFDNGNSGSGNDFNPALGLSGSGVPQLFPTSFPSAFILPPGGTSSPQQDQLTSLDFGTLHVGDPATLHFIIENFSGDAGFPVFGALQTAVNGASVTDPALSGSGVTPQDFSIPGRGSFNTYDITLDTSHAGTLQDQAIHIAFLFNGTAFNTGVTLPITGAVLDQPVEPPHHDEHDRHEDRHEDERHCVEA